MAPNPHYPVPSLDRGLDMIETLAAAAVPQSLGRLAVAWEQRHRGLFWVLNGPAAAVTPWK